MKKQVITMVGVLLAWNAGAQTQRGNGLLSGSVGVMQSQSRYPTAGYSRTEWQPALNLTAGRFVADNWLVGLSVSGQSTFEESTTRAITGFREIPLTQTNRNVSVTTTPFVRRYFQFSPVYVFVGAGVSVGVSGSRQTGQTYNYQTSRVTTTNQRTTGFSVSPSIEAGANYFLTGRLALQLTVSANSLPFTVAGFGTGLTYWTGPGRQAEPQPERENPQTNRGNWLIEGSFAVSRANNRREGTDASQSAVSSYNLSPSVGYFIGKNNLIGVSLPVGFFNSESAGAAPNREDAWSVGIAPYYQHYFAPTRLTPYVRTTATYLMLKASTTDETVRTVGGNVSAGLAYMAGQRFIVETSLANASFTYSIPSESFPDARSWNARLSAGLSGNFTVRYVLTRAK